MKFLQEFKTFAVKGNVIDMAIGIIIGTAFNKIVTSLVEDLVMPPIGYFAGGVKFTDYQFVLSGATFAADGVTMIPGVAIRYGHFLQVFVDFLIIAFSMFMVVKVMNRLKELDEKKRKRQEVSTEKTLEVAVTKEAELLTEIRDLLKKNKTA